MTTQVPEHGQVFCWENEVAWQGDVGAGQNAAIGVTLRVIHAGWGLVYGNLSVQPGGEIPDLISDVIVAEIYVDQYKGRHSIK